MTSRRKKYSLIFGVTGQDGAYLAKILLNYGYVVLGTSRNVQNAKLSNLITLGIQDQVKIYSVIPENYCNVNDVIHSCQPHEIYYLSGQSSVGISFNAPAETIQSFALGSLNVLEACRHIDRSIRVFIAGSGECFGETGEIAANEQTRFQLKSPYAVGKAAAYWITKNYREIYSMYACTGILFNHESPLRPSQFVTKKILDSAKRIKFGSSEKLMLGRLDVWRDWGWAPEYVEAMWLMLQKTIPDDYVIATGESNSLEDFVNYSFQICGLDWREHVIQSKDLFRTSDIYISRANPLKAKENLPWSAKKKMREIIETLINLP